MRGSRRASSVGSGPPSLVGPARRPRTGPPCSAPPSVPRPRRRGWLSLSFVCTRFRKPYYYPCVIRARATAACCDWPLAVRAQGVFAAQSDGDSCWRCAATISTGAAPSQSCANERTSRAPLCRANRVLTGFLGIVPPWNRAPGPQAVRGRDITHQHEPQTKPLLSRRLCSQRGISTLGIPRFRAPQTGEGAHDSNRPRTALRGSPVRESRKNRTLNRAASEQAP